MATPRDDVSKFSKPKGQGGSQTSSTNTPRDDSDITSKFSKPKVQSRKPKVTSLSDADADDEERVVEVKSVRRSRTFTSESKVREEKSEPASAPAPAPVSEHKKKRKSSGSGEMSYSNPDTVLEMAQAEAHAARHGPRQVIIEGYLEKHSSGVMRMWQKRYFVLPSPDPDGSQALMYFHSMKDRDGEPAGVISVSCIKKVVLKKKDVKKELAGKLFDVIVERDGVCREFELRADATDKTDRWVECILDATRQYNERAARKASVKKKRKKKKPTYGDNDDTLSVDSDNPDGRSGDEHVTDSEAPDPDSSKKEGDKSNPKFWKRKSVIEAVKAPAGLVPISAATNVDEQIPKDLASQQKKRKGEKLRQQENEEYDLDPANKRPGHRTTNSEYMAQIDQMDQEFSAANGQRIEEGNEERQEGDGLPDGVPPSKWKLMCAKCHCVIL